MEYHDVPCLIDWDQLTHTMSGCKWIKSRESDPKICLKVRTEGVECPLNEHSVIWTLVYSAIVYRRLCLSGRAHRTIVVLYIDTLVSIAVLLDDRTCINT